MMTEAIQVFSEEFNTFHWTRSLDEIIKKSGFNILELIAEFDVKSIFDVPGVSTYDLELAVSHPDLEFHLFDKNPQCLKTIEYLITGDESILNNLSNAYASLAKQQDGFFHLDESRFHFYEGDLAGDLDCFSEGEFDLGMCNYVFQYIPLNRKANALINLGKISDNVLITKLTNSYDSSYFGNQVTMLYFYEGIGEGRVRRHLSLKRLSEFLGKKVDVQCIQGPLARLGKYSWVNVNVLGF